MSNNLKSSLDRRLSGVQMSEHMKKGVLREIARQPDTPMKGTIKMRMALIAALVATLLLAGIGVAVNQSEILKWLSRSGRQPSDVVQNLVRQEDKQVTQNGIRVKLVESLLDVDQMVLTWEIESLLDEPVLLDVGQFYDVRIGDEKDFAIYNEGLALLGGTVGDKTYGKKLITTQFVGVENGALPTEAKLSVDVFKPLVAMKPRKPGNKPYGKDYSIYKEQDVLSFDKHGLTLPMNYQVRVR